MPETANDILNFTYDDQKNWVGSQDWYQKEGFEQSLRDAEITALAVPNLEETLEDHLVNYDDYGSAWMLEAREFISPERADELEEKGNFTEEEKDQLRECLILDAVDDLSVIQARSLKHKVEGIAVLVTYYGSTHPMDCSILDLNFLGIFENEKQIEEAMGDVGVVIENFLAGFVLND